MAQPLIGVLPLVDRKRDSYWMLPGYMKGIQQSGGIPLMLPLTRDPAEIRLLVERLDGFLFTGGQDVNPELYGQDPLDQCGLPCVERDELEQLLFQLLLDRDKPVFGICRGLQLMNVLLGGSLYQDIPTQTGTTLTHAQEPPYHLPVHPVAVHGETPLWDLLKTDELQVNSYHHQGIRELSPYLAAMATAPDGIVEAVYHPNRRYIMAVQWHPEFSLDQDRASKQLFDRFVAACK